MTSRTKIAGDVSGEDNFLGCDVSKDTVTFYSTAARQTTTVANTARDLTRFLKTFTTLDLAVCEATGGYEATLLTCLTDNRLPAHRADAVKVKNFIRSRGTLAKTDAIDARALALYGAERRTALALWQVPGKAQIDLQALVQRRMDLIAARTAEKNRAQAPGSAPVIRSIRAMIKVLTKQIEGIEKDIHILIDKTDHLTQICKVMRQIKGVGPVTSITLCALMPELGTMTGKQAASLAGLAPHPNQSGKLDKYRKVRGGRQHIRPVLYMAAMAAANTDPLFKPFYRRLIAAGKKPIVALTAVMRKLVVIINARVRDYHLQIQS